MKYKEAEPILNEIEKKDVMINTYKYALECIVGKAQWLNDLDSNIDIARKTLEDVEKIRRKNEEEKE